ncbi:protein 5NUC [Acyrthosiphon pisum]|uniref:5'-nucleotidase n=1 Tax=Acyrthosiphon pisum TaxID=7029 RepID=A0A8R2B7D5_ACYPI|nr:protein 5NUC [Acyrthosiphon pisum]|eukprot:XP_008185372.1 PREDICTED: protein 5NUC [Acyrthosiphon pisum]
MAGGLQQWPRSLWTSVLFLSLLSTAAARYRLLVLHTNDMHSRFDQIDAMGAECIAPGPQCYGGFPRLKTAVDQERRRADTDTVDGTLFLNAGDTFQGTAYYSFFKWRAVERMIRTLGIDVMSLGNHEFDDGVKDVESFLRNITIPVVASNLDLTDEPVLANEPNLMKSKVLTVNGRRIGIIGYLTPDTERIARTGNVKILPEIPSVAAEAKRLKNDGVDILIALGHSGFEMDIQIARDVEDIDLVIGGHSNTFLYTGKPPGIDKPVGSYPFMVEQPNTKRKVPVVQADHITKYLGELWMEFDDAGEVVTCYGNPILLDYSIKQDPKVLNEVRMLKEMIENKTKEVIGSSSVFLEGENEYCRFRECNLGNFITDSFVNYNIRKNIKSFDLSKYWTNAPISLIQAGGIRTNINNLSRRGNITLGDLLSTLPFKNDIGKITTTGLDIWTAFEYSVRRYSTTVANGEFLQVSGLKVVIDFGRPSGERVQSIHVRCGNCAVPGYEKLDLNANYTIIMSKYLSDGGDGFSFKKLIKYQSFGTSDLNIMEEEFHVRSPIWPEVGQRIVLLNVGELNKVQTTSSDGQRVSTPLSHLTLLLLTIAVTLCLTDRLIVL